MGLRKDILQEPISELSIRDAIKVRPGTSVRAAADLMRQKHLGCVIVVDDGDRPIGKFTERQLMKLVMQGQEKLDQAIEAVMYRDAHCVRVDEPVAKLLKLLQTQSIRFACVVDAEGKAIGLTGQKGLMEFIGEHFPRAVKVQTMQSKLYMDQREGA